MSEIQRYGTFSDYILLRKQDDGRYVLYADFETLTNQFAEQTQQLFDTRAERDSLKAQLAAMQWTPITPENLPKEGDEVLSKYEDNEVRRVKRIDWDNTLDEWLNDYSHFRPINPPKEQSNG